MHPLRFSLWSAALLWLTLLLLPLAGLRAATLTCPAGHTACLADAVLAANASAEDTTLLLETGVYTLTAPDPDGFLEGDSGLPVLTGTLTIEGQGAALTLLQRAPTAPLFRMVAVAETGALTLRRLTLQGGAVNLNLAERGGGLLNFGTVLCDQAVLRGHSAWVGGAIDNVGVFTMVGCAVSDNFADFVAAGIAALGPTSLERSVVSDNISEADAGLSFDPGAGRVEIRGSAFTNNLGTFSGGGALGGTGMALLVETVLSGNLSGRWGGAIVLRDGLLTLRRSPVIGNSAVEAGGGIAVESGEVRLVETPVVGNVAGLGLPGRGGGLFNLGGVIRARESTILHNRAAVAPDCQGEIETQDGTLIGNRTGCTVIER